VLSEAEAVADVDGIYFPHSLDFRGRIYPIASYLSPQGYDLPRALLTFSQSCAVDDTAAKWLALHGANRLGDTPDGRKVSALTLDERVEWVHNHTNEIIQAAERPFDDLWWAEADKPLQFWAFCREWADLIRTNDRGEVFYSSLPCAMDGTCNGLQHFSALLRDESGARAVNVVPQDGPQDVYAVVAEKVLDRLAQSQDPIAMKWLGIHQTWGVVTRKLTKQPTMTFGYGSNRFGFTTQIISHLKDHPSYLAIKERFSSVEDGKAKDQFGHACKVMAEIIWMALGDTITNAFAGMDWMRHATKGASKANREIEWSVPGTGFRVRQEYYKEDRSRIATVLGGAVFKPSIWVATDKVDSRRQASGIAPNFVHSCDAAALMMTVVQAKAEGVESFAMIHDSYGTLAGDCETLSRCCRSAFARLYTHQDVLGGLYRDLAALWDDPSKCPPPPSPGELDVSHVLASRYFFS
jgi:DNA-directed RNA polymerase